MQYDRNSITFTSKERFENRRTRLFVLINIVHIPCYMPVISKSVRDNAYSSLQNCCFRELDP